jgi:hypothetical protein
MSWRCTFDKFDVSGEILAVDFNLAAVSASATACAIRNTRSRPLVESLKQWLEERLGKLSRKSDTALAVRYALGRWEALLLHCDDGRLEIPQPAASLISERYVRHSFQESRGVV